MKFPLKPNFNPVFSSSTFIDYFAKITEGNLIIREFSICSIFSVVCYSPCRMFQMNFEEHQNGAMSIRRLFGMLFVFKTVAKEEINMSIFIA